MLNIRRTLTCEWRLLSEIAYKSEAYWGYEFNYMEKFRSSYQVNEDFISNNQTYVIENYDNVVGFYGLLVNDKVISLEYFFIEPQCIGKGYGKLLWNHLVNITCENLRIYEFEIVTSPQTKEFYIKLGAIFMGEVESLLKKGRMIPRLLYKVHD